MSSELYADVSVRPAITADAAGIAARMSALRKVGVPYSDEEIAGAGKEVEGKTELDVLIAYLQGMGIEMKGAK